MMEEKIFKIYWPNVIISSYPIWLALIALIVFKNVLFQQTILGITIPFGSLLLVVWGVLDVFKRLKEVRVSKTEILITNILTKSQLRIPVQKLTEIRFNTHAGTGHGGQTWDLMEFHFKEPNAKFTQKETIAIWSIKPRKEFFMALSEMPCECTRNGAWADFKELAKGW